VGSLPILAISEAMTRTTAAAKGGTIITSNGGDGNMVETTPAGQQVAMQTADKKTGAGALFSLAIAQKATAYTSSSASSPPESA
jgi:hypothetical protein